MEQSLLLEAFSLKAKLHFMQGASNHLTPKQQQQALEYLKALDIQDTLMQPYYLAILNHWDAVLVAPDSADTTAMPSAQEVRPCVPLDKILRDETYTKDELRGLLYKWSNHMLPNIFSLTPNKLTIHDLHKVYGRVYYDMVAGFLTPDIVEYTRNSMLVQTIQLQNETFISDFRGGEK